MLEIGQWGTRIHVPPLPLSDLYEYSFQISGLKLARITWNSEWYQISILVSPGGNSDLFLFSLSHISIFVWILKNRTKQNSRHPVHCWKLTGGKNILPEPFSLLNTFLKQRVALNCIKIQVKHFRLPRCKETKSGKSKKNSRCWRLLADRIIIFYYAKEAERITIYRQAWFFHLTFLKFFTLICIWN